jgi:GNAT superfamily N-acetyltransferase
MTGDRKMIFSVRGAAPRDAAALAALVRALNAHQGDPAGRFHETTLTRDVFGPDACLGAFVAEDAHGLIGYAFFHDGYESAYAARGLYLCDLYVMNEARRNGVGRALVAAVAYRAKERGRTFLWWVSRGWNDDARKFYASLGVANEPVMAHALTFAAFESLASEGDEAGGA